MQNILILGATGLIGKNFLNQLLSSEKSEHFHIYLLSHSEGKIARLKEKYGNKVQYINTDILDLNALTEVFEEYDFEYIFHSAQFPHHPVEREWLGERYTYLGFELRSVQNIEQALRLNNKHELIKQYIYISAIGIEELNNLHHNWTLAKREAETLIKESYSYTIMRPSWVYGAKDKSMNKFIFFAKYLPIFPMIGSGENLVNPVWVDDIGQICLNALDNPHARSQTFEIATEPLTMNQIAQTIMEATGLEKPIIPHPKPLMKAIGFVLQWFLPSAGLSPGSIDFITMQGAKNPSPQEILNVTLKTFKEGLKIRLS